MDGGAARKDNSGQTTAPRIMMSPSTAKNTLILPASKGAGSRPVNDGQKGAKDPQNLLKSPSRIHDASNDAANLNIIAMGTVEEERADSRLSGQ